MESSFLFGVSTMRWVQVQGRVVSVASHRKKIKIGSLDHEKKSYEKTQEGLPLSGIGGAKKECWLV